MMLKKMGLLKPQWIILLLILTFLLTRLIGITSVGAEYDELLVINAALGCPNQSIFLEQVFWFSGRCVPIMLSTYIGASTAYLYQFFFLFLPTKTIILRLIHVLMVGISLVFFYQAFLKKYGNQVALIAISLLVFDAQFLFTNRFDRPTILPFLLKSLFFYVWWGMKKTKVSQSIRYIILGCITGLSIYTKLDAIYFFAALGFGYVMEIFFKSSPKPKPTQVGNFLSGLLIGLAPFLFYLSRHYHRVIYISRLLKGQLNLTTVLSKLNLFFTQLSLPQQFSYVFAGAAHPSQILRFLSVLLVISWFAATIYLLIKHRKIMQTTSLIIFFIFYITYGGLFFSHHRLLIYPLPQIIIGLSLGYLKNKKLLILFFLTQIIVFMGTYYSFTKMSFQTQGKGSFDQTSYQLYQELKDHTEVVIADWGIATQLIFYSQGKLAVNELAFLTNQDYQQAKKYIHAELEKCQPIVLFVKDPKFKLADQNWRQALDQSSRYQPQEINNIHGEAIYQVFECH